MQGNHGLFYPVTNRFGIDTPLLYWCRNGLHVALTSSEQGKLLDVVASDDSLRRLNLEKHREALLNHLTSLMLRDRDEFISRYVYRDKTGDDARDIFPSMVVGYGVVNGHARLEPYRARTWAEAFDSVLPLQDTYTVHLVGNQRWPFQKGKLSIGAVLVAVSTIQGVRGSIQDFLLTTDGNWIRFAPGGVFVIPKGTESSASELAKSNVLDVPLPA